MNFKLFKKYIDICKELHKEPTWKGVQVFKSIFQ